MRDDLKIKLIEELLGYLRSSQGGDLKSLLDEKRKPMEAEVSVPEMETDKPKGLKVESVEIMKPEKSGADQEVDEAIGDVEKDEDEELSDEDLKDLLDGYLT
jgi:hypothetical protein